MASKFWDVKLTLVGLPGAGKTSFLAALGNSFYTPPARPDVHWSAMPGDVASRGYLQEAWDSIEQGDPVRATSVEKGATAIRLTLRRREVSKIEKETHVLALEAVDTPGEITLNSSAQSLGSWEDIKRRIAEAHVVLVAIDAMNMFHQGDAAGQRHITKLFNILQHACDEKRDGMIPLSGKALALCFCKCDAQTLVDIDGIDDDNDALVLASRFLPNAQRRDLLRHFGAVRFFAVSILRRDWRWLRHGQVGACVRVGDSAIAPVGVFEPFEWITTLPFLRPK